MKLKDCLKKAVRLPKPVKRQIAREARAAFEGGADEVAAARGILQKYLGVIDDDLGKAEGVKREGESPDRGGLDVAGHPNLFGSGLGLKREEMPQVPEDRKAEFFAFLKERGVGVEEKTVSALSLKPTQGEMDAVRIGKLVRAGEAEVMKKRILVSRDGYVIDGHHRWAAQVALGFVSGRMGMPVTEVDFPIREALKLAREFNEEAGIAARPLDATTMQVPTPATEALGAAKVRNTGTLEQGFEEHGQMLRDLQEALPPEKKSQMMRARMLHNEASLGVDYRRERVSDPRGPVEQLMEEQGQILAALGDAADRGTRERLFQARYSLNELSLRLFPHEALGAAKVKDTGTLDLFAQPSVKAAAENYVAAAVKTNIVTKRDFLQVAKEDGLGEHAEDLFSLAEKNPPTVTKNVVTPNVTGVTGNVTGDSVDERKAVAADKVANLIVAKLDARNVVEWQMLFRLYAEAMGGRQSDGVFTPKDAYDALELGINRYLLKHDATAATDAEGARQMVRKIKATLARIPTQSKRTAEMDEFQQFSTIPSLAYAANWVANLLPSDLVLEPSAGIGGLAVFAKASGAEVVMNELSPRRAAILRKLNIGPVFTENAEQIDNVLPASVQPTVVVMNPPFSATAGRMQGVRDTSNATRHIEQALARLPEGGRLVAIVGSGMKMDSSTDGGTGRNSGTGFAFKGWWDKMQREHTVRANVQVSGQEYAKYGTTFDNQLLVIDKIAPAKDVTVSPVVGRVEKVEDLIPLLEPIRHERLSSNPGTQGEYGQATRPDRPLPTGTSGGVGRPVAPVAGTGGVSEAQQSGVGELDFRGEQPAGSGEAAAGLVGGPASGRRKESGGGGTSGGPVSVDDGIERAEVSRVGAKAEAALTDSVYDAYQPRIVLPGTTMPPVEVQESAAMAAVDPITPTYRPAIPARIYQPQNGETEAKLSALAMESITLAGNAHQEMLPMEYTAEEREQYRRTYRSEPPAEVRRGFFIGDGTGMGKGRQVAGVIFDNWLQGRKRAIWISEKPALINDAKRDLADVAGMENAIFEAGKTPLGRDIEKGQGIAFTTYSTLRSVQKDAGAAQKKDTINVPIGGIEMTKQIAVPTSRLEQLVKWFGPDFDGVIAFDEAHNMANNTTQKGKRGMTKPSAQALMGLELQRRLPKARVVYLSATGATEVANLGYGERLGLWGAGTAFTNKRSFIENMTSAGLAAMELVAQNLKAMGLYLARSISWKGVGYSKIEHTLTPDQRETYDTLAEGWQNVLGQMDKALEAIGAVKEDPESGKTKVLNKDAKSAVRSAFWGSHQRFFNQVITSMKMPTVLADADKSLAAGEAIVMQLVNTNEAAQNREIDKRRNDAADSGEAVDFEDLDLTPRDILMQMVEHSFPVVQQEEYTVTLADGSARTASRPALDSQGQPILNKQAVAMRDALLDKIGAMRVPDGPLEMILNHFGAENVAEVTGRTQRLEWVKDEKGNKVRKPVRRSKAHGMKEADEFMGDKRRVLVFSNAGGTGRSYHADRKAKNRRVRNHILVQAGWQAAQAIQGFGRTHRNNQQQPPRYSLATSDVVGEARFISSIARRLDQLGALTKGSRQTGSQGFFKSRDNLESEEARAALKGFYSDVLGGRISSVSGATLEKEMGLKMRDNEGQVLQELPPITQFLNRLLSLKLDTQRAVFDAFSQRLDAIIESKLAAGTLDQGMENLTALSTKVAHEQVIHVDERSGAETKYVKLALEQESERAAFPEDRDAKFVGNVRSGKIYQRQGARNETETDTGRIFEKVRLRGVSATQYVNGNELIDDKRWTEISRDDAREIWAEQFDKTPLTHTETVHFITGTILPVWDRVDTGNTMTVRRVQTEEGKRMIGLVIRPGEIAEVLRNFGADVSGGAAETVSAADAIARIGNGATVRLQNGWNVKQRMVSGEQRIELTGPEFANHAELDTAGVFRERIQFKTRYFIPVNDAARVLGAIVERHPVASDEAVGSAAVGGGTVQFSNATMTSRPQMNALGAARVAYHGTPHEVDKFSTQKIGTGEGAQVYGWGLYFAEEPMVATEYAKNLASVSVDGRDMGHLQPAETPLEMASFVLDAASGSRGEAVAISEAEMENAQSEEERKKIGEVIRLLQSEARIPKVVKRSNVYTVHLDVEPEELLDWDKPLSEQSEKIRVFADSVLHGNGTAERTGELLYRKLLHLNRKMAGENHPAWMTGEKYDNPRAASEALREAGIPGIRYLDQGSRQMPSIDRNPYAKTVPTYNYVIFDDSRIKITHRNGEAVPLREALGAAPVIDPNQRTLGFDPQITQRAADFGNTETGRIRSQPVGAPAPFSPVNRPPLVPYAAAPSVAELVKDNMGLAVTIANDYRNIPGHDFDNVLGEARKALVKAAQGFDPAGVAPFGAYAGTVVRNTLNNLFNKNARIAAREAGSAELPAGEDGEGATMKDSLVDERAAAAVSSGIEGEETRSALEQAMQDLPERVRTVLTMHGEGAGLREIGAAIGLSHEMARRILKNGTEAVAARLKARGFKGVDADGILFAARVAAGNEADMPEENRAAQPSDEAGQPSPSGQSAREFTAHRITVGSAYAGTLGERTEVRQFGQPVGLVNMTRDREIYFRAGDKDARWAIFDSESGQLIKEGADDYKPTDLQLKQWGEAAAQFAKSKSPVSGPVYLRFGKTPKDGRSLNHATGQKEAGVSVYGVEWNPFTQVFDFKDADHVGTATFYIADGILPHLVKGTVIGKGSDGEPLLRDVTRAKSLVFDRERGGYVIPESRAPSNGALNAASVAARLKARGFKGVDADGVLYAAKVDEPRQGTIPVAFTILNKSGRTAYGSRYYDIGYRGRWHQFRFADHVNETDNMDVVISRSHDNDAIRRRYGMEEDQWAENSDAFATKWKVLLPDPLKNEKEAEQWMRRILRNKTWIVERGLDDPVDLTKQPLREAMEANDAGVLDAHAERERQQRIAKLEGGLLWAEEGKAAFADIQDSPNGSKAFAIWSKRVEAARAKLEKEKGQSRTENPSDMLGSGPADLATSKTGYETKQGGAESVNPDEALNAASVAEEEIREEADRIEQPEPEAAEKPQEFLKELLDRTVAGRMDSLDAVVPGAKNLLTDAHIKNARIAAALRIFRERIEGNVQKSFGYPSWWRKPEQLARLKRFTAELLPTAARLNAVGRGVDGKMAFESFWMRAGELSANQEKAMGLDGVPVTLRAGVFVVGRHGEKLRVKGKIETFEGGRKRAFWQMERFVEAKEQARLHEGFHTKYPEVAHWLDSWIDPNLQDSRVNIGGIELPDFNRFSLREFWGEISPFGEVGEVQGYTPDIFMTKSLVGMIAGRVKDLLNRTWTGPGREYKSGEARERGQVRNLFEGFNARAAEAHQETERRKLAEALLAKALKAAPDGPLPRGWVKWDVETVDKLLAAYHAAQGLDPAQYQRLKERVLKLARGPGKVDASQPEFATLMGALREDYPTVQEGDVLGLLQRDANANPNIQSTLPWAERAEQLWQRLGDARFSPEDVARIEKLAGKVAAEAAEHRGKMVHAHALAELRRPLASTYINNGLLRMIDAGIRGATGGYLANPFTLATNQLSNELFVTMHTAQRALYGLMSLPFDRKQGKLGLYEAGNLFKGMLTDRWYNKAVREMVPDELFDGNHRFNTIATADFDKSPVELLRELNITGAVLKGMRYGNVDTRAKQRVAFASYMAHGRMAYEEARANGKVADGTSKGAWIKDWIQNLAPDSVHRSAYYAAVLVALDYANVPPALDETNQVMMGGRDVTAEVNLLRRGIAPFAKFPYNLARQGKRFTLDSIRDILPGNVKLGSLDVTRGAETSWAQKRQAVANLTMMSMLYLLARAMMDDDKDGVPKLGREVDDLGHKLEGAYNTAGRINITDTTMGRTMTAALDMFGLHDEADAEKWVRIRAFPYASSAVALATLENRVRKNDGAHQAEAQANVHAVFSDLVSEGILLKMMNAIRDEKGPYDAGKNLSYIAGETGFDMATGRFIPPPLLRTAAALVDPVTRRSRPVKSLDYDPGLIAALRQKIPGMATDLPPAGKVVVGGASSPKTLEAISEIAALGLPPGTMRSFVDEKGRAKLAYVMPSKVNVRPRVTELFRAIGLNVKFLDGKEYRRELEGDPAL